MRGFDDGYPVMDSPEMRPPYPKFTAPKDPLDIKDQHLVALATRNGFLAGRNSVLESDVDSLKRRVMEQERMIKEGTADNKRLRERNDELLEDYHSARNEANRLKQYEPKDAPEDPNRETTS
jgi:hypothetical protein